MQKLNNALTSGSAAGVVNKAKIATALLISKGTCLVDVSAFVGRPLIDTISQLRSEGWLSPPSAHSTIVLIHFGQPFAEPGVSHVDPLSAGASFEVFEVFSRAPCDLYRTVPQNVIRPCVIASPGNAFTQVSPLACAVFSGVEFDEATCSTAVVTGLSLEGRHSGCLVPLPTALARSATPAPPLIAWCPASAFAPGPLPFGVFAGSTLWAAGPAAHEQILVPVPPGSGSPAYFCYKLPAGANVGIRGFGIVFDNCSQDRLMHCSVVRRGPASFGGWQMDASGIMTRPPGVPPPPAGSAEVFPWGGVAAPGLAALFLFHCFIIRGRAGYTKYDADEPGADLDVADALDAVARLAPEDDFEVESLLREALTAHYSLARMDDDLLQSLAAAIEHAALIPMLWPAAAEALSRGARRLREWAAADATVLLYAASRGSGDERGSAPAGPPGHADARVVLMPSALLEAAELGEVADAGLGEGGVTPLAPAHVRRAAAPSPSTVRAWCTSLKLAAESGRVSLAVARAHSTEVVLNGVPRSLLAGVMADLKDPLTQRILLACAMRALGLPVTDSPAFVYATCARAPSHGITPPETHYTCGFSAAARSDSATCDAALATERTLDIAVSMWGLPSLDGRFRVLDCPRCEALPMAGTCIPACCSLPEPPHRMPTLTAAAAAGEVRFVLDTCSHRAAVDAPALAVRLLRAHGFPDARILDTWESQSEG